jgi:hypothetical protein
MAGVNERINTGLFVPTTEILAILSELRSSSKNSEEFKDLIVRLGEVVNRVNLALNKKESGLYFEEEFLNGNLWGNLLSTDPENQVQEYWKVLRESSDPWANPAEADVLQAGTTNFAHGLSPAASTSSIYTGWKIVDLYGGATNTVSRAYYPLNFSGATYISARADATNVIIDNQSGVTFDKVDIVLRYLKF